MSSKNHVMRIGILVLALFLGACLSLTGCGGSSSSAASGAPSISSHGSSSSGASGTDSSACASFEQAYKTFLAADASKSQRVSAWHGLTKAVNKIIGSHVPTSGVKVYMASLGQDAYSIYIIISQGAQVAGGSPFNSDLEKVGNGCGTTFTPGKTSI